MPQPVLDYVEGAIELTGLSVEVGELCERVSLRIVLASLDESGNLIGTVEGGIHAGTYPRLFFTVNVRYVSVVGEKAHITAGNGRSVFLGPN
jgi:hypothetical protein